MKQLDWSKVFSNSNLREGFVIDVKNRFEALSDPSDDTEKRYTNLITSTEEIAVANLPKKERSKKKPLSQTQCVKNARKEFEKAKQNHDQRVTRNTIKELNRAKSRLDEAYLEAEAAFIQGEINQVSYLHTAKRHDASWR